MRTMANKGHLLGLLLMASSLLTCRSHPLDDFLHQEISNRDADGIKSYAGYKLFRTDVSETLLPIVDSMDMSPGVEVWSWKPKGRSLDQQYEIDVLSPPDEEKQVRQVFSEYELPYQEVIRDLQIAINNEQGDEIIGFSPKTPHSMTWDKYHSTEDMYDYMSWLEIHYPNLVTIIDIGKSFENRSLLVAKISGDSDTPKPAIWIDGGLHAREWISPATAMYILNQLVEYQWEYEDITGKFDWYIMPLGNPDGYEYTRNHDRLWRKNRAVNPNSRCVGVDLNRNFGYRWRTGGSSLNPCSDIYAGPSAESEPETQAIRDFIMELKDQLKVYVSIHAYSQMWMLPFAGTYGVPENYDDMYEVGKLATDAIRKHDGTDYTLGSVTDLLYIASGGSGDFAYAVAGIPFSYSLELRDLGQYGFILPKEQILPTGIETYEGIRAMAAGVLERLPKYEGNSTSATDDLPRDSDALTEPSNSLDQDPNEA
ncbi:carboxypeptidase B-like [Macrobrachium nipponense]|uniref:carboxypeptidase B-like n=1 Tax=Macrobrachium nipponense TaxID=159736 RepID=UPI0030C7ED42